MKKILLFGASMVALALWSQPAHAGPAGLILDLLQLGMNAADGTIPRPFVTGFGVLILAIVVLGVLNARKNAAQDSPPENPAQSGSIRLDK